ncbi:MAG TPA: phosphate ABC transporter substrate-binding protein PstS [Actinomycetales bacterium]|nr:phosphate ABC transporter substrate-binding protein PstS [Actinomycetales bacterium]
MKRGILRRAAIPAAVAIALGLSACGAANEKSGTTSGNTTETSSSLSGSLAGAGASSQAAAMEAWIAGFSADHPDANVSYDPVGSGGGREQFLAGGTAFAGSDAYLKDEEVAKVGDRCEGGELIEMPLYVSPIAVIFNLDGVKDLNLSADTIAKIFDQKITKWNDPAIAADNPGAKLPDTKITPVNRSDESGTTENFTEYLAAAAPSSWKHEPSGDWPVSGGEAAQGTSGVVGAVQSGNGTIGYADASQAGDLGIAKVKVGEKFVAYSPEAAAAVVEHSKRLEGRGEFDYAIDLARDTTAEGTYPIVLVSYTLACTNYSDAKQADLVKGFLSYVVSEKGQEAAAQAAGSAPISGTVRDAATKAIEAISSK